MQELHVAENRAAGIQMNARIKRIINQEKITLSGTTTKKWTLKARKMLRPAIALREGDIKM